MVSGLQVCSQGRPVLVDLSGSTFPPTLYIGNRSPGLDPLVQSLLMSSERDSPMRL